MSNRVLVRADDGKVYADPVLSDDPSGWFLAFDADGPAEFVMAEDVLTRLHPLVDAERLLTAGGVSAVLGDGPRYGERTFPGGATRRAVAFDVTVRKKPPARLVRDGMTGRRLAAAGGRSLVLSSN